jgi:hypothetical protein
MSLGVENENARRLDSLKAGGSGLQTVDVDSLQTPEWEAEKDRRSQDPKMDGAAGW